MKPAASQHSVGRFPSMRKSGIFLRSRQGFEKKIEKYGVRNIAAATDSPASATTQYFDLS